MSEPSSRLAAELDRYLRTLPPSAQGKLLRELERSELGGHTDQAHRLILERLRTVVREERLEAQRTGSPQRLFCEALEPFLVDEAGSRKHRGWIQRASLNAMWRWLSLQLEDAADREERASAALLDGDVAAAQTLISALRRDALHLMETALHEAGSDTRQARRLAGMLGGQRALADLADIASVVRLEAPLAALAAKLPEPGTRVLPEHAHGLLDRSGLNSEDLVYGLRLIYHRLANPAEMLQILVSAAGTDDASKLRHHRFAACVDIVLADLDFAIERIARHITRPAEFEPLVAAVRRFHCLSSGMSVAIDLDEAEQWRTELTERRRRVSEILRQEVARAPGAIRRALKPRRHDGVGAIAPDPQDVADAEHAAQLVVSLRPYRSEVAVNQILAGVARQVESFVEAANPSILQNLRSAMDADKPAARAVFAAALSINEIVFGADYAALLRRSGRLADPPPEHGHAEDGVPLPAA